MSLSTDVLIVGAGPVGMTLAMELSIQGVSFRIVDKMTERPDTSRAVGVQSRTLEMLNRYGDSLPELLDKSSRMAGNAFWVDKKRYEGFDGTRGAGAARREPDTRFAGIFAISQVDTEAWFERRLAERGVKIEHPVTVKSITQEEKTGATAVLVRQDGSDETLRTRYIVGCDGAHSIVRHSMNVEFRGDAYAQEFILGDTLYDWPEAQQKAHIFIGDGMGMLLPLTEGRARFVASRPKHLASDADPTAQDLQDFIGTFIPDDKPKPKLHDPFWLARFHLHHRCATSYRDGRLFIAGDAAHIHSPVGAQGMNTGIQDSANLGWKLAAALRGGGGGGGGGGALLDSYHEERWPVGQHLLRESDRLFSLLTAEQPDMKLMRDWLLPHALPSMTSSPEAGARILRYFSELNVRYRTSPMVATAGGFEGPPRGGYRAPDGRLATSTAAAGGGGGRGEEAYLQDLLRGPGHHLLLFTTATGCEEDKKSRAEEAGGRHLGGAGNKDGVQIHVIDDEADVDGSLHRRYGFAGTSGYVLVRPDGYIGHIGYLKDMNWDEITKKYVI